MDYIEQIKALEARARALNLMPGTVYRKVGVSSVCFWRWKSGKASPTISNFNRSVKKVSDFLAAEEARLNEVLHPKLEHERGEAA